MKRRQSAIPFERLRRLANDSPYMSPLSPNPAQAKRMKRRATMMSTFKTYCEINTQTSPLEEQHGRKSITINERLNSLHNGNKSDSSGSVISFSKALVDEPDDIYMSNTESRNELKLKQRTRGPSITSDSEHPRIIENHLPSHTSYRSLSRSNLSKSNLRKSKSSADLDINNSFVFSPPVQSDKRSTIIPSSFKAPNSSQKKSPSSGRKSIARNQSEILSDRVDAEVSSSRVKSLSKSLARSPTKSPGKSRSRLSRSSSNLAAQSARDSSSMNSTRRSSSARAVNLKDSAINTLPADEESSDEEEAQEEEEAPANESIDRKSSRLSSSRLQISSTPKASSSRSSRSASKHLTEDSSFIQANGRKSEIPSDIRSKASSSLSIAANGRKSEIPSDIRSKASLSLSIAANGRKSEIPSEIASSSKSRASLSIVANGRKSEIPSELASKASSSLSIAANGRRSEIPSEIASTSKSRTSSSSKIVPNGNSEIKSSQSFESSVSSRQPTKANSEILSAVASSSRQESSSATSYASASDVFIGEPVANKSEIVTSDEVNMDESRSDESRSDQSRSSESQSDEPQSSEQHSSELENGKLVEQSSEIHIEVNNNSNITFATNNSTATGAASTSAAKGNSEILTNHITDLDDSMNGSMNDAEDEKNRNSVKSANLDYSLDDDYEVNADFNSISKDLSSRLSKEDELKDSKEDTKDDPRYSKIADESDNENEEQESGGKEDVEEENQQESNNEMSVDLGDESKRPEDVSKDEEACDLKNSSFSRIEPNFSGISVSFEPSIDQSTVNHLDKNPSENATQRGEADASSRQDSEFKVPEPPKRQANRQKQAGAIHKQQQPKFYETMVNKTPTIIYPQTGEREQADEQDDGPVRRSSRIRVKPLEYWRNQKLKYKIDSETKCFTIEGVEKGFKPENPFSKKTTRPASNKRKLNERRTKLPKIKEEKASSGSETESSSSESESSSDEEREPVKKVRYTPNEESIHQPVNESALVTSERIKKEAAEFYSKQDLVWAPSKQSAGVFIALMNRKKSPKTGTQASGFIKMEVGIRILISGI